MELSKRIRKFYETFIAPSSDEDSDDDTELLVATVMVINEYTYSGPMRRGSVKGRAPNLLRSRERGHYQLYRDYFHPTRLVFDA